MQYRSRHRQTQTGCKIQFMCLYIYINACNILDCNVTTNIVGGFYSKGHPGNHNIRPHPQAKPTTDRSLSRTPTTYSTQSQSPSPSPSPPARRGPPPPLDTALQHSPAPCPNDYAYIEAGANPIQRLTSILQPLTQPCHLYYQHKHNWEKRLALGMAHVRVLS